MIVYGTANSLFKTTTAFIVLAIYSFMVNFSQSPFNSSRKENNFFSGQIKETCLHIAVGLIVVLTLRESNMLILQSSQFELLFLKTSQIRPRSVMK